MSIETLDDIIEEIANGLNIYGSHLEGEQVACRCCFVASLKQRIRDAVRIEQVLEEYLNKTDCRE